MLKRLVIAAALAALATTAPAQEQPMPPTYRIEVTPQQLGVIAAGLNELPKKIADPIFVALKPQVDAQNLAAATAAAKPAASPAAPTAKPELRK